MLRSRTSGSLDVLDLALTVEVDGQTGRGRGQKRPDRRAASLRRDEHISLEVDQVSLVASGEAVGRAGHTVLDWIVRELVDLHLEPSLVQALQPGRDVGI